MRTKDSAIKYAQQYLLMIKDLNIRIEKAFLFGSFSQNKQGQFSDIDIAIVSKDFTDNPLENWKKVGLANIKYNLVEPHLYTWKEFKSRKSFLKEEILKTGIEISIR